MEMKSAQRVLIFNVNWLGDVLFSTATIRNIRRNYPNGFVACVIPSRCYPVLKGNPYLDEIIIFDEKDRHKNVFAQLKFVQELRDRHFDVAYLLHRSFSRALICRLAGIPQRFGHYTRKRSFLLTKKIIPPPRDSLHRIDYYLDVIEKSGLKVEDRFTDFYFSAEDVEFVDKFLNLNSVNKNDSLVVLNPGGNWYPKRWPKEYWSRLADKLIQEFNIRILITGSHNDLSLVEHIRLNMKEKPIIGCGVFNLKQLGALSKRGDIFITADTGPLHIANSVGTKNIIAIFGPTSPEITGPFPTKNVVILQKDSGCKIPCYQAHCKDNRCMRSITPEEVAKQVKLILKT